MYSVHNLEMEIETTDIPPRRTTYRHGDLRRVLLEAGVAQARVGGPDAVVLREATRQAGVVPNAAYRHFASREALLKAVRAFALSALAQSMEAELKKLGKERRSAAYARDSLRAVGTGYLRFAQAEPGLFRTAFSIADEPEADAAKAGESGLNPFQLLGAALDRMLDAGLLSAQRRQNAEYLAWSAVHGMALLMTEGPLGRTSVAQREAFGQRLLDMVEKGL
ncbi:MAG: putative transcriptional regulator, TetR family [Herminiimonas sp.]|nr:putative transcriptional regulator, TetR family [Herminiimonas sp.]